MNKIASSIVKDSERGQFSVHKIMIPVDFSDYSKRAADVAVEWASLFEAHVVLYHSCYIPPIESELVYLQETTQIEESKKRLEECKKDIQPRIEKTVKTIIDSGSIAYSINRICYKDNIDLVIMGTKGASGLKEVFLGSVSADVIHYMPCHVLVVPKMESKKSIERIVFATDFTTQNADGLSQAIHVANRFGAQLECVAICKELTADIRQNMRDIEAYAGKLHANVSCHTIPVGKEDVAASIEKYINQHNVDLLITVKHVRNAFFSVFQKSISEKLSYHINIPLLVLKV